MRPSRFDYIMFLRLLILMAVMAISSCTTTRHTVPTADDLAGSPMYYGYSNDPFFDQPASEIDLSLWPKEGDHGIAPMPVLVPESCDHFYVTQATPARDSVYVIHYDMSITLPVHRYRSDSIKVVATSPCICIYCHHLNTCF